MKFLQVILLSQLQNIKENINSIKNLKQNYSINKKIVLNTSKNLIQEKPYIKNIDNIKVKLKNNLKKKEKKGYFLPKFNPAPSISERTFKLMQFQIGWQILYAYSFQIADVDNNGFLDEKERKKFVLTLHPELLNQDPNQIIEFWEFYFKKDEKITLPMIQATRDFIQQLPIDNLQELFVRVKKENMLDLGNQSDSLDRQAFSKLMDNNSKIKFNQIKSKDIQNHMVNFQGRSRNIDAKFIYKYTQMKNVKQIGSGPSNYQSQYDHLYGKANDTNFKSRSLFQNQESAEMEYYQNEPNFVYIKYIINVGEKIRLIMKNIDKNINSDREIEQLRKVQKQFDEQLKDNQLNENKNIIKTQKDNYLLLFEKLVEDNSKIDNKNTYVYDLDNTR